MTEENPRPVFASITQEGAIALEWGEGAGGTPEAKRMSIYVDSDSDDLSAPLEIYAILTGPTGVEQEMRFLRTPGDILQVLADYKARKL